MRNSLVLSLVVGLGTTLLASVCAIGQSSGDLTAEELEALFATQKTRGLVIVPSAQAPEVTPENAITPAAYVELAKNEQVNIQVSFDFDSAVLRDDQKPKLEVLCKVMAKIDVDVFRIVGHTDASGSADYNERLSLLRAQEVKRHMVTECGIPEAQLQAVGVGEQFPFNTSEPRADENRRVEFQALS